MLPSLLRGLEIERKKPTPGPCPFLPNTSVLHLSHPPLKIPLGEFLLIVHLLIHVYQAGACCYGRNILSGSALSKVLSHVDALSHTKTGACWVGAG